MVSKNMIIFPEFWKFVECINWQQYITDNKRYNTEEIILTKVAPNFTWEEFASFELIYKELYHELTDRFHDIWLSDEYDFMPSDDGYTDLISSIIGKGWDFYSNVNEKDFIKMANNRDYLENFGYLFHPVSATLFSANTDPVPLRKRYELARLHINRDIKLCEILK